MVLDCKIQLNSPDSRPREYNIQLRIRSNPLEFAPRPSRRQLKACSSSNSIWHCSSNNSSSSSSSNSNSNSYNSCSNSNNSSSSNNNSNDNCNQPACPAMQIKCKPPSLITSVSDRSLSSSSISCCRSCTPTIQMYPASSSTNCSMRQRRRSSSRVAIQAVDSSRTRLHTPHTMGATGCRSNSASPRQRPISTRPSSTWDSCSSSSRMCCAISSRTLPSNLPQAKWRPAPPPTMAWPCPSLPCWVLHRINLRQPYPTYRSAAATSTTTSESSWIPVRQVNRNFS